MDLGSEQWGSAESQVPGWIEGRYMDVKHFAHFPLSYAKRRNGFGGVVQ